MGLDAHVRCRCWQDAKTTPPPIPVELIVVDENDDCLDLRLPYRGNEELFRTFDLWVHAEACPHEDMDEACEHIGNWSGYESFRTALGELGWEKFPTLKRYLPDHNGGRLPAQAALAALAELRRFIDLVPRLGQTVLLDHNTGEVIWRYINDYARAGMLYGTRRNRLWIGLDRQAFFVRDTTTDPPTELFRTVRFDAETTTANMTKLTDGAHAIELPTNPFADVSDPPPARLRVEVRARAADEHSYATDGLTTVLRASIDTGNPVNWT